MGLLEEPTKVNMDADCTRGCHLVILQHGIWGSAVEMENLANGLNDAFPGSLKTVSSTVNEGHTMDGVEAGGRRLAELVKRESPESGYLSFVCHSLGGLYARWALRVLQEEGWFDSSQMRPANFITTATPHLGILELGAFWRFGLRMFGKILGQTIKDLSLNSSSQACTTALETMCDDISLAPLRSFQLRVVYGNVQDDMWCRPCTSLITATPPEVLDLPAGHPTLYSTKYSPSVQLPIADVNASAGEPDGNLVFPESHRKMIDYIRKSLEVLRWERYVVDFPAEKFTGAAHAKICNHARDDVDNLGVHVVKHVCDTFWVPPET